MLCKLIIYLTNITTYTAAQSTYLLESCVSVPYLKVLICSTCHIYE